MYPLTTLRALGDLISPCRSHSEIDTLPRTDAERKDGWFYIRLSLCNHGCGGVDSLHGGDGFGLGRTRVKAIESLLDSIRRILEFDGGSVSESVKGLMDTMREATEEELAGTWEIGGVPSLNRGYQDPKKRYTGKQNKWFECGVKLREDTTTLLKTVIAPLRAPARIKHDTHEGALAVYIDWAVEKGCDFGAEDLYVAIRDISVPTSAPRYFAVKVTYTPSYEPSEVSLP